MGHTEKISDYEMDRGWTVGPHAEGVDIEASRAKGIPKEHMSESEIRGDMSEPDLDDVTTSKVVEPEKKTPAKKSTAKTKSK
jgi:hypothetical protein